MDHLLVIAASLVALLLWAIAAQHIAAAARRSISPGPLLRLLETVRAYIANEEPSCGSLNRSQRAKDTP